jgi:DNA sulfur modification protein DndD
MVVSRLQISSIKIQNYRQYHGEQVIDLEYSDENKTINAILGENGNGKSNILNAVNYCLYLSEPHLKLGSQKMPIINTQALDETKEGGILTMSIELLIKGENIKYKISRTVTVLKQKLDYEKIDNENIIKVEKIDNIGMFPIGVHPTLNSQFGIARKGESGWDYKPIERMVNSLLPEKLSPFYFLDGEFLESLHSTFANIKRGIEELSHITITQETIKHLGVVIGHLQQRGKGISKDADEQLRNKINYENWLKSTNELGDIEIVENYENIIMSEITQTSYHPKSGYPRLKTKKQDRDFLTNKIKEVEQKLIELKAPNVSEWTKDLQKTDDKISTKQNSLYLLKKSKMNSLIRLAPTAYAKSAIDYMIRLVDEKREKGELPVKYTDVFVSDLKDKGTCICGEPLDKKKIAVINDWQVKSKLSEKLDSSVEATTNFKTQKREMKQKLAALDKQRQDITDLEEEIDELNEKKMDLKSKLEGSSEKEVADLYSQKEARESQKDNISEEIGKLEGEINQVEAAKRKANDDYTGIVKSNKKFQQDQDKIMVLQNALNNLEIVKDIVLEKVKNNVEQKTKTYFYQLIWKQENFKNVTLSDDYKLTVVKHSSNKSTKESAGYDATQNLSAGEKLVLALSFIAAIREITAIKMPLIIDTPLGKISGIPTKNIAEFMPEYFKDTQVTLLVTDKEYRFIDPVINSSFRKLIQNKVSNEYELFSEEKSGITKIMPMKKEIRK